MKEEVPGATDEPRSDADAAQAEAARDAGSDEVALGASSVSGRDPRDDDKGGSAETSAEASHEDDASDEVALDHGALDHGASGHGALDHGASGHGASGQRGDEALEREAEPSDAGEEDADEQVEHDVVSHRSSSNGAVAASYSAEDEPQAGPTGARDWYILKVQSNREDSIREALERRIKIAGLEGYFGEIIVPIEKVTEFKGGKKRIIKRKLYPGYLVVHMELNDDTWFLVRETHGIGDFTGAGGKPTPMLPHEVNRILSKQDEKTEEAPKLKIAFKQGDRVKIREGTFENFEGDVDQIDEANGRVTVMINIFGRSTPVELEYWQIEAL